MITHTLFSGEALAPKGNGLGMTNAEIADGMARSIWEHGKAKFIIREECDAHS